MSTEIRLKRPPKKSEPAKFSTAVHGYAYISIQSVNEFLVLVGKPGVLAKKLRELADSIEPTTVKVAHAKKVVNELPDVLYDPYKAWPWLVERFPWLFDGISLSSEPYAHYLKSNGQRQPDQLIQDVKALRPYMSELFDEDGSVQRGYTRKAAALLFGDENANGGNYLRRIKAAMKVLMVEFTTTTPIESDDSVEERKAA